MVVGAHEDGQPCPTSASEADRPMVGGARSLADFSKCVSALYRLMTIRHMGTAGLSGQSNLCGCSILVSDSFGPSCCRHFGLDPTALRGFAPLHGGGFSVAALVAVPVCGGPPPYLPVGVARCEKTYLDTA